jgi:hypothetical protein
MTSVPANSHGLMSVGSHDSHCSLCRCRATSVRMYVGNLLCVCLPRLHHRLCLACVRGGGTPNLQLQCVTAHSLKAAHATTHCRPPHSPGVCNAWAKQSAKFIRSTAEPQPGQAPHTHSLPISDASSGLNDQQMSSSHCGLCLILPQDDWHTCWRDCTCSGSGKGAVTLHAYVLYLAAEMVQDCHKGVGTHKPFI